MANITAKDVADLRAKTGIGMMECKKALVEANGDVEEAIKILRKRGELKAEAKAATRIAADGIVDIMKEGDVTAMIEVNSETDFVAKNASFQEFVKNLLKTIIAEKPADLDALMAATYVDGSATVEAKLKEMIFVIGEKLSIRRFVIAEGLTSTYIHGTGTIGVIVTFDGEGVERYNAIYPLLVETKGPNPIEFENGYVAFEDLPDDKKKDPDDEDFDDDDDVDVEEEDDETEEIYGEDDDE